VFLESFKYLVPLLGVLLGAFIAPYIDLRRSKKESIHALDCFYAELNDYLDDSSMYAKECHKNYMKSKKVEMGIIKKDSDLFPLRFYPKIEFLTVEYLIEKSFLDLTKDQRKAVKALVQMTRFINECTDKLSKLRTTQDFQDNKAEFYSATTTCASFYYLLNRMTLEKGRFIYIERSTEKICQDAMDALNISFDESVF